MSSGLFLGGGVGGCKFRLSQRAALNANCSPFPPRNEAAVPFIKEAGEGGVRVILDALEKNILFLPAIETRFFGRLANHHLDRKC